MSQFCWMISRMCLTAWVGIASFFVVVLIRLRGSPLFSDETKLSHPKVLFPIFYTFEFWLLGTAVASGLLACRFRRTRGGCFNRAVLLAGLGLLLGTIDHLVVYRPLAAMIELPTRPPEFATYHSWSRWLNLASLVFCATGAGLMLWPGDAGDRSREAAGT